MQNVRPCFGDSQDRTKCTSPGAAAAQAGAPAHVLPVAGSRTGAPAARRRGARRERSGGSREREAAGCISSAINPAKRTVERNASTGCRTFDRASTTRRTGRNAPRRGRRRARGRRTCCAPQARAPAPRRRAVEARDVSGQVGVVSAGGRMHFVRHRPREPHHRTKCTHGMQNVRPCFGDWQDRTKCTSPTRRRGRAGEARRSARGATSPPYKASCWYAIDWNDSRCRGETPSRSMAARCSGVE